MSLFVKRPATRFFPGAFFAEIGVKQRDQWFDVINFGDAEGEGLAGACEFGIRDVDIVNVDVMAVLCGDEGLAEVMYVLELIGEACRIVQIRKLRRPELLRLVVKDRNGLAR